MPGPILRTARLTVRPMTLADADDLASRRSDPETAHFQGWEVPYPLESAVELIEEMIARGAPALGGWTQFACARHEDGVIVGDVALHLDEEGHNGEIGFTLHIWARGQGYATEAAAAILNYGFTVWDLHRCEASIDPRNAASRRVLEHLGFRHEGTMIESYWQGETVMDDARYALLRREWEARPLRRVIARRRALG